MAQFEINIKMNDEDRVIVDATIPREIEPEKLIYGLWCHIRVIAEYLHEDKRKIIFMAAMTDKMIEQNKDKVEEKNDTRCIAKRYNRKGGTSMKGTLIEKEAISDNSKVAIPLFDYSLLVRKSQLLADICAVASRDKLDYSYSSETSKTIDTLLGIERKEKAD